MPKITRATRQKSNIKRINLFIDEKFFVGIDELIWVKNNLCLGKELPVELLQELELQSQENKAYEKALKLLGIRPQSTYEMRQKLAKKFDSHIVRSTIVKLKQDNLLDDKRFALIWIEERSKNRLRSTIHLIAELRQKGIANDTIKKSLQQTNIAEHEAEIALTLAQKKMRQINAADMSEKVKTYLARKGFSYKTILEIEKQIKN